MSYKKVVIETYHHTGGGSAKKIRARPVKGQDFDTSMNVECSSKMRKSYPVGTKFLIDARVSSKEGGTNFLYSHYESPYEIVTDEQAQEFIANIYGR